MTSENVSKEPVRWIPIREENSGKKPFDFAHQRIIEVKRDEANKLDDKKSIKNKIIDRFKRI